MSYRRVAACHPSTINRQPPRKPTKSARSRFRRRRRNRAHPPGRPTCRRQLPPPTTLAPTGPPAPAAAASKPRERPPILRPLPSQVCESLGVPLEVVPLTTEYWDRVVSSSVDEIRAGRTPNPDMWCNSRVKFGAFYDYLDRTYGSSFDRVASGHYARVERVPRMAAPGPASAAPGPASAAPPPQAPLLEPRRGVAEQRHGYGCVGAGGAEEQATTSGDGARGAAREGDTAVEAEAEAVEGRRASNEGATSSGCSSKGRAPRQQPWGAAGGASCTGGATGEQAGTGEEEVRLLLTPDAVKDQTYFLANLSPHQLSRVMFPLGCMTKAQVGWRLGGWMSGGLRVAGWGPGEWDMRGEWELAKLACWHQ